MYMDSKFFIIPSAVYYYCLYPALAVIVGSIIFTIIYRRKKGTENYAYTLNYVYTIVSMLLSLLLLPLLLGYAMAMIRIINSGLIENTNKAVIFVLILLPLIPLVTLIFVFVNYVKNVYNGNKKNMVEE